METNNADNNKQDEGTRTPALPPSENQNEVTALLQNIELQIEVEDLRRQIVALRKSVANSNKINTITTNNNENSTINPTINTNNNENPTNNPTINTTNN